MARLFKSLEPINMTPLLGQETEEQKVLLQWHAACVEYIKYSRKKIEEAVRKLLMRDDSSIIPNENELFVDDLRRQLFATEAFRYQFDRLSIEKQIKVLTTAILDQFFMIKNSAPVFFEKINKHFDKETKLYIEKNIIFTEAKNILKDQDKTIYEKRKNYCVHLIKNRPILERPCVMEERRILKLCLLGVFTAGIGLIIYAAFFRDPAQKIVDRVAHESRALRNRF